MEVCASQQQHCVVLIHVARNMVADASLLSIHSVCIASCEKSSANKALYTPLKTAGVACEKWKQSGPC